MAVEPGSTSAEPKPGVLICGASFAGLATAFWMHRLGYAVTVVEVAKDVRKGGTPVDIREGVVEVVRRMGLLDRIATYSLKPRPMELLGPDVPAQAKMLAEAELAEAREDGHEIERDTLLGILFDEVKDDVEFLFGNGIAGLEQSEEDVAVTLTNGQRRSFALVLGCDGTHSAVRRLCFGEESAFVLFMQTYFSLTIVDKLLIPEDTAQMYNSPGHTVMLSAYNGKTDIAFCFRVDEQLAYDRRRRDEQKQMICQQFAGEGWRVAELLAEMSRSENFYFDQLCQIRMKSWVRGRVALVGDAGYCPSPTAGMGGSMAILGAAALADAFGKYPGDYLEAFKEYDTSFRPTVDEIQSNALEFGLEMVMPGTKERMKQMLGAA